MRVRLPEYTLHHVLQHSVEQYASRPAFSRLGEAPITYQEFGESVRGLSQWIKNQGVSHGDKVVILSENCPHWGIAYFAVTSMGAVVVPVLVDFHPDAIAHIVRHAEAKMVFVSEKLFAKVEDAGFDPSLIFVNIDTFTAINRGMSRDALQEIKNAGLKEFRKFCEKVKVLAKLHGTVPKEDDMAAIIYTSGTSGHSKGVMLSHKNIVYNASIVQTIIDFDDNERVLSILPLAHTFECTMGFIMPILHGMHIFYLDKPPTARVLLPAFEEVQPTVMATVPLVMEKIYKNNVLPTILKSKILQKLYPIPFIRKFIHAFAGKKLNKTFGGKIKLVAIAGAPLATESEKFFYEAKFPYCIGYGLTEASPLLSATSPANVRLTSAGKAVDAIQIRISNQNPATGEGEIQAKGMNIMLGYFKAPEITAESFTEDGWLKTGDLGYIDNQGYVYIKGRSKNMVLGPSGENIYPEEIESFFLASPYVAEVLVYQQQGKLVGRVHLDTNKIDELFGNCSTEESFAKRLEFLEKLRTEVNGKVSTFARVMQVIDQAEPFEKTPTQKIKRYLYG